MGGGGSPGSSRTGSKKKKSSKKGGKKSWSKRFKGEEARAESRKDLDVLLYTSAPGVHKRRKRKDLERGKS